MSKLIKNLIAGDLEKRFNTLDSAVWIEIIGVDGITTNDFRRALRSKHIRLEVVKNALFRRAAGKGPLAKLAEAIDGPAALVTGGETIVEVAEVLEEWAPKIKGLRMRGAVLEGTYIDESAVKNLSKMPTKRDLQGQIVRAI